jgi:antitoxin CcdA
MRILMRMDKQAVNLSLNRSVVREARRRGLNLSRFVEQRLREYLGRTRKEDWLVENRAAIQAYNERIARDGIFGDDDSRGF